MDDLGGKPTIFGNSHIIITGWWFQNICYFHPENWGNDPPIWRYHIFQMGWKKPPTCWNFLNHFRHTVINSTSWWKGPAKGDDSASWSILPGVHECRGCLATPGWQCQRTGRVNLDGNWWNSCRKPKKNLKVFHVEISPNPKNIPKKYHS